MSDVGPAASPKQKPLWRRLAPLVVAILAVAFVVSVVPFADRCVDPAALVLMTRVDEAQGACRLEKRGRATLRLDAAACAKLHCEPGLVTTFTGARSGWLSAMLALYALGTLAWAVRWRALLGLAKIRLSVLYVWRVVLEAQAGGIILPGGVAGDALRIGAMVGKGAPLSTVVASVLLNRVVGLVTLASVAGALALFGGALTGEAGADALGGGVALALASFPLGLVLGLVVVRHERVNRFLREGRLARFAREPAIYLASDQAIGAIARATAASVVVSLLQLLVIRGLVTALGGAPTMPVWVFLGAAMAFMVAAVPVLPGGWGTSDAAFVFFCHFAGLSPQIALGAWLLYRAFWYLSGLLGALLGVARARSSA